MKDGAVDCLKCGHVWARDPVLEVPCPVCKQKVGSECVVRAPSGHVKNRAFGKLPPWGHDERDLLADRCGAYRHSCTREAEPSANQGELF